MSIEVGDKVRYVPDTVHALIPDAAGRFPFKFGVERIDPETKARTVVELSQDKLIKRLQHIRRSPNGTKERSKLVVMGAAVTWPAYVTAVHEDGTVDLHIKHKGEGNDNALDCPNVKIDPTGKTPHTCH